MDITFCLVSGCPPGRPTKRWHASWISTSQHVEGKRSPVIKIGKKKSNTNFIKESANISLDNKGVNLRLVFHLGLRRKKIIFLFLSHYVAPLSIETLQSSILNDDSHYSHSFSQ